MPIPGQENINIGAQNEAANSDSLFTAFNKAQNNFTTLFSQSSQYTNFVGSEGISTSLNSNTKTVTVNNTGVTKLTAGTGITVNSTSGNVVISVSGYSNGTLVAGVTNVGITSSTLKILNSPIVSSGTMAVDLPIIANLTPGTYYNPQLEVDSFGRITSVQTTFTTGTVTSVQLQNGPGISVSGGPIVSDGTITVTNTGVRRLNPGPGILLTDTTGEITISANLSSFTGTVSRVTVTSNTLSVSNPTITLAGNINIELPTNLSVIGNVTGGGNFTVGQNISIDGNVTANGNLVIANVTASGRISTTGNINGANILANGLISASGNIVSAGNLSITSIDRLKIPGGTNGQVIQTDGTGNLTWVAQGSGGTTTAAGGSNTQVQFNDNGTIAGNANLVFNKLTGVLTAGSFSGTYTGAGNNLSNIQGANVSGIVANANFAETANLSNTANFVSNSTQINITTLGNLVSLSVVGNIKSNNSISVLGSITSDGFMYAATPATSTANTQVATTAYVNNKITALSGLDLSTYAPINNPIFTGTPQAPTVAQSSPGSNALATTNYVKSAVSGLAPTNDPIFTGTPQAPTIAQSTAGSNALATTNYVKSAVSGLAPINDPIFTGTPQAPTIAQATAGSNALATTSYVKSAIGSVPSVGVGQTWQDFTASRGVNLVYYNFTGNAIMVAVTCSATNPTNSMVARFNVNSTIVASGSVSASNGTTWASLNCPFTMIIPNNSTYSVTVNQGTLSIARWWELR